MAASKKETLRLNSFISQTFHRKIKHRTIPVRFTNIPYSQALYQLQEFGPWRWGMPSRRRPLSWRL